MYRIEKYIYPSLGHQLIDEMTTLSMRDFIKSVDKKQHVETGHRILTICSLVFRFGIASGLCDKDPCQSLKCILPPRVHTPRAALTKIDEVAEFMRKIHAYPFQIVRNVMLFNAYTFCRPSEVRTIEWSEIDLEKKEWLIPAEKMKMRKSHRVPLSSQCIKILKEMQGLDEKYVFPSPRKKNPYI